MSLLKCEQCGEMYSDSYRSCPFCEEDAAYYNGGKKAAKRKRIARDGKKKTPGIIGPVLILAMVLIIAAPVWLIFGNDIRYAITGEAPPVEDHLPDLDAAKPDDGDLTPTVELTMDGTMLLALDESKQLAITGGTEYEWISSNPDVAIVSSDGTVKAVTEGTTTVTATDVSGKVAVCSVTVTKEGSITPEPVTPVSPTGTGDKDDDKDTSGPTKPTITTVDASKLVVKVPLYGTTISPSNGLYDVQLGKNESFQLKIEGTDVIPKWSSDNTNKVSVSSDGTIKWVSSGETHVHADLNGVKLDFLVRAK